MLESQINLWFPFLEVRLFPFIEMMDLFRLDSYE